MIALAYLAVAVFAGDALASRWFSYVSIAHRLATGLLVGILLATWTSYLASLALSNTVDDPVLVGGLLSAWGLLLAAVLLRRIPPRVEVSSIGGRGGMRGEWIAIGLFSVLVAWMMITTYDYNDGTLEIGTGVWSDFGPTTAIAQSFALGNNFPTEYPHYAGEPIRYHFLYYFQVGNLTHLGLDPALANNLLSIATLLAMLVLVMSLGVRLFRSRLVGWIGAGLFFFHGALSFIPYVAGLGSVSTVLDGIAHLDHFMVSGFPYRGEEWGIWTQIVFLNQRHLASAIGILLAIVLFLLDRNSGVVEAVTATKPASGSGMAARARRAASGIREDARHPVALVRGRLRDPALGGYLVCGLVAGLLPLWNGAIFFAAAALLAIWFVLFPNRIQMLGLAGAAAVVSIPQLVWVRPGTMAGQQTYPSIFWGYTLTDATAVAVATYLGFIFGPKLVLAAVGLVRGSWRQARVLIAFSALVAVAFLIQLSVEVLANHKFINAWLVVLNLFAAYGVVTLWQTRRLLGVPARLAAIGLVAVVVAGGVIDLMPIRNSRTISYQLEGDRLFEWVTTRTEPKSVFLSDLYAANPILLAGRRLYYGWSYYAWSAGYAVRDREQEYRALFATRSARDLAVRLSRDGIDYVAFDDGLRERGFAQRLNEDVFRASFDEVFADPDNHYAHLAIYRVPTDQAAVDDLPDASPADMYRGGRGTGPGELDRPRGVATDERGTVFVADTGNNRIERFSSSGGYISTIGAPGSGRGQLAGPMGVAADRDGRVWVADTGNRRVEEFGPGGAFVDEWNGPDEGFGQPVDVAVDAGRVFVLDAGTGRVVRRDPDGTVVAWGGEGAANGQLSHPTGIAVASGRVVVADAGNARIVEFDDEGTFVASWPVTEWSAKRPGTADVAVDSSGMVWASSPADNAILVYRPDGSLAGRLAPRGSEALDSPGSLAIQAGSMFVANVSGDRISLLTQIVP
ncbi:MAG TPA: hypothetical protein VKA85_02640 [Candidatus Limnocylindrales bacterium]|nr:hypothetical protein [Candidatus Limnocylindrales bacterium]